MKNCIQIHLDLKEKQFNLRFMKTKTEFYMYNFMLISGYNA